jgi:hypothetical protein
MNPVKRYAFSALLCVAAFTASTASQAQSPFDGTWKTDPSQAKRSHKPIVFYISQGWYHCVSCTPAFDVQADGQEHAVTGRAFDSVTVTVVDAHTITFVGRIGGKVTSESTRTVSADGKTLSLKVTEHPKNSDQPVTHEAEAKRSGTAPAGVHATSGDWIVVKETGSADHPRLITYKVNGDSITMSDTIGESYTAKFDGADYPVNGAYFWDAVSLKKINDHAIEKTNKHEGKVTTVSKLTVSGNGKSMTIDVTDEPRGSAATFMATKQ